MKEGPAARTALAERFAVPHDAAARDLPIQRTGLRLLEAAVRIHRRGHEPLS